MLLGSESALHPTFIAALQYDGIPKTVPSSDPRLVYDMIVCIKQIRQIELFNWSSND